MKSRLPPPSHQRARCEQTPVGTKAHAGRAEERVAGLQYEFGTRATRLLLFRRRTLRLIRLNTDAALILFARLRRLRVRRVEDEGEEKQKARCNAQTRRVADLG